MQILMTQCLFFVRITFFTHPHKLQNLSFNLAVMFFHCSQELGRYRQNKCTQDFRRTLYNLPDYRLCIPLLLLLLRYFLVG
jgi:hypothetical protein